LVPVVAVFFGIVIRMYYREHEPPHFPAEHQGQQATFDFSGTIIAGDLQSRTARRLIRDWALLHRSPLERRTRRDPVALGRRAAASRVIWVRGIDVMPESGSFVAMAMED
jgi:hypothetical protein